MLMTIEHPRWQAFRYTLAEGMAACHHDHRQTRATLQAMAFTDAEIEASVAYFCERGGYCDCEVLMNVGTDDDAAEGALC